ncbi:MAG TPA: hypothetical protein VF806_03230 [Anaerolineaceae bacterium]
MSAIDHPLASDPAEARELVLSVRDLHVTYLSEDGGLDALEGVDFNLYAREYVCLL